MAGPLIVPESPSDRLRSIQDDYAAIEVHARTVALAIATLESDLKMAQRRLEDLQTWLTKSSE